MTQPDISNVVDKTVTAVDTEWDTSNTLGLDPPKDTGWWDPDSDETQVTTGTSEESTQGGGNTGVTGIDPTGGGGPFVPVASACHWLGSRRPTNSKPAPPKKKPAAAKLLRRSRMFARWKRWTVSRPFRCSKSI